MERAQAPEQQGSLILQLEESKVAKTHVRNAVEKYVLDTDNKLDGSMHPALNITSPLIKLDSESHKWVEKELDEEEIDLGKYYKNVEADEQQFIQAMEEYEKSAEPKYKTNINPKDTHTMKDVWAIVDAAVEKYKVEDVKGFWGKIRKAFRKLGENNEVVDGWLGLLPTESNYLSVLCGGLKLILGAATRMRKLREDIFEALEEIPLILNCTQRVLAIHRKSERLQNYSSALYVSILSTMAHMIGYLRQKSAGKIMNVFFKQNSFESSLSSKLDAIKQCSEAFNKEAAICSKELQKRLEQISVSTNRVAKEVYQQVGDLKQMIEVIHREQKRTEHELQEPLALLTKTCESLNNAMALFASNPLATLMAFSLVKQNSRLADAEESNLPLALKGKSKRKAMPSRDCARIILTRLTYDKDAIRHDVLQNLEPVFTLSLEDQDRSVHVMQSPILANWATIAKSTALVINGNSANIQRRSPFTFICAKLADSLYQVQSASTGVDKCRVMAVHFFCGEHVDLGSGRESINTPCGIANSVLAQLLRQCKHLGDSLDLIPVMQLGDLDGSDMDAVCARMEMVFKALPRETVVFCIIDALSYYLDDDDRDDDANLLVAWLLKFSRNRKRRAASGCMFKLLLTAPNRLHLPDIEDLEKRGVINVLDVPSNLPQGGGFTSMQWDLSAVNMAII